MSMTRLSGVVLTTAFSFWLFLGQKAEARSCVGALASLRPTWSLSELRQACEGADGTCMAGLALARPAATSDEMRTVCTKNRGGCVGDLALARPSWSMGELADACQADRFNCAGRLSFVRPMYTAQTLNHVCENSTLSEANCVVSLALACPNLTDEELRDHCR